MCGQYAVRRLTIDAVMSCCRLALSGVKPAADLLGHRSESQVQ